MRTASGLVLNPPPLRVLELAFEARAAGSGRLRPYLASAIRGATALALKAACCPFETRACAGCPLAATCVYAQLFEAEAVLELPAHSGWSQPPRPLVFEVPRQSRTRWRSGQRLRFGLKILGRAVDSGWVVAEAVRRALAGGLGSQAVAFELERITCSTPTERLVVWEGYRRARLRTYVVPDLVGPGPESVHIQFVSPVRLQRDGRVLERPSFKDFAMGVIRRVDTLAAFHEPGAALGLGGAGMALDTRSWTTRWQEILQAIGADQVVTVGSNLRRVRLDRWSSRQKRWIWLDGLVGTVEWQGRAVSALHPYLVAGSVVHVGKGTIFGLGAYRLEGARRR